MYSVQEVTVHVIYYLFIYFILPAFLWVHVIHMDKFIFRADLGASSRL